MPPGRKFVAMPLPIRAMASRRRELVWIGRVPHILAKAREAQETAVTPHLLRVP